DFSHTATLSRSYNQSASAHRAAHIQVNASQPGQHQDLSVRGKVMSVRVRIAAIGLVIASLLMVVGCSKLFPARSGTAPTSNASITERWTSDALTKAFSAINDKIGANPADYIDLGITKYSVRIQAINPQNRQNVDEYKYDGSAVTVAPV